MEGKLLSHAHFNEFRNSMLVHGDTHPEEMGNKILMLVFPKLKRHAIYQKSS